MKNTTKTKDEGKHTVVRHVVAKSKWWTLTLQAQWPHRHPFYGGALIIDYIST